jgi:hydrogenase maturation protease
MNLLDTNLVGDAQAPRAGPAPEACVLILAVGNLLMGDEGVGIHVIRTLERSEPIEGVRLMDGGTGGINLLEDIQSAQAVILVDATRDGAPAGTVRAFRADAPRTLPQGLSAHDFGLKDLFAAAAILGAMPEVRVVTVSVESVHPMCLTLTPEVASAVPRVVDAVRHLAEHLVSRMGAGPGPRRPG